MKADSVPPSKRPTARPPESDEDESPSSGTRVLPSSRTARPGPTGKASSKSDASTDTPPAPKPPKAKGKAAAAPGEAEEARPAASSDHIPEPPAKVPSTSKRKQPAPPKAFVESESESDDEPPPPRTKASKPKDNAQPTSKDPGDVASAKEDVSAPSVHAERPGGSSKRRRDEHAVAVPPVELGSEPLDDLGAPAEDEESGAPKPKKGGKAPHKRAAKSTEEMQDESAGTSRKRERGKQSVRPSTETRDEQPQEPDEPPAPPRKRTKRAAASDLDIPADVPDPVEKDVEEPDDTPEEPAPKPRSKPASRSKKAPASRDKAQTTKCVYRSCQIMLGCSCHCVVPSRKPRTLKENFPAASRTSHQKPVPMYKPKPKVRWTTCLWPSAQLLIAR